VDAAWKGVNNTWQQRRKQRKPQRRRNKFPSHIHTHFLAGEEILQPLFCGSLDYKTVFCGKIQVKIITY
jgi:hypothetical protein